MMIEARHERTTDARFRPANGQGNGFLMGLVGGVLMGAAAGVLLAPQIQASIRYCRRELTDAMADARRDAAGKYHEVREQVGEAIDDLQEKGRDAYGKALHVVTQGADDVKVRATEAQADLNRRVASARL
jgi:gas vesicle protein